MVEYLLGLGAAKAGTTLLYDLLIKNAVFSKGRRKELHYFDKVNAPSLDDYLSRRTKRTGEVLLDITPVYMFYDGAMKRMANTIDVEKARFVILLRDPIQRAISYYCMSRRRGFETLSFEQAFRQESARMKKSDDAYRHNSYFTASRYAWQLDGVFEYIPRENALIWLFEDFVKNQQSHVDELMDFIEKPRFEISQTVSNAGYDVKNAKVASVFARISQKLPGRLHSGFRYVIGAVEKFNAKPIVEGDILTPEFRRELVAYFTHDVLRLRDGYGVDISKWKNFKEV
ncbi:MAG: sulfotransferase [Clostridia bacterium]|nr:sulfotransferase [Clostridia bacterium]